MGEVVDSSSIECDGSKYGTPRHLDEPHSAAPIMLRPPGKLACVSESAVGGMIASSPSSQRSELSVSRSRKECQPHLCAGEAARRTSTGGGGTSERGGPPL